MGADRVIDAGYQFDTDVRYAEDSPVHDADGSIQFEPFRVQWRTLTSKDKLKKAIFLFSVAAAVGYYLFLGLLVLIG